jgi:hypothetical protein
VDRLDTDKLRAATTAPNEPALHYSEQEKLVSGKGAIQRLKGTGALAATALLAGSLLLTACGDDSDDCIVSTPPTNAAVNLVLPPISSSSVPTSTTTPSQPSSSQFTSGTSSTSGQTYCRSRRTGGFYWYSGTRYYSSSGS